jgi:hypothetical protein
MNQCFGTQIFIKTLGATKAVRAELTDALGDVLRLAQVRWVSSVPSSDGCNGNGCLLHCVRLLPCVAGELLPHYGLWYPPVNLFLRLQTTDVQEDVGALPEAVRATHYGRLLESGCTLGQCGIEEGDFINVELRLR